MKKLLKKTTRFWLKNLLAGREFTIGVFRSKGKIITLPITEIKTKKEFFDFEAKYTAGFTDEVTPAEVDESIAEKVRDALQKKFTRFLIAAEL